MARFAQWFLFRLRIFFFIGVFGVCYYYLAPVVAFGFVIYIILNDLLEIALDIDELKGKEEENKRAVLPAMMKRKGF